jgi:hypothetical protein
MSFANHDIRVSDPAVAGNSEGVVVSFAMPWPITLLLTIGSLLLPTPETTTG